MAVAPADILLEMAGYLEEECSDYSWYDYDEPYLSFRGERELKELEEFEEDMIAGAGLLLSPGLFWDEYES